MKFDKITITIQDSGDDTASIKLNFKPEPPENKDDVEESPSLYVLGNIMEALQSEKGFVKPSEIH